jgi:hypothetical protein
MLQIPAIIVVGTYSFIVGGILSLSKNIEIPYNMVNEMHLFIR